jgi:hypothetical protein
MLVEPDFGIHINAFELDEDFLPRHSSGTVNVLRYSLRPIGKNPRSPAGVLREPFQLNAPIVGEIEIAPLDLCGVKPVLPFALLQEKLPGLVKILRLHLILLGIWVNSQAQLYRNTGGFIGFSAFIRACPRPINANCQMTEK